MDGYGFDPVPAAARPELMSIFKGVSGKSACESSKRAARGGAARMAARAARITD